MTRGIQYSRRLAAASSTAIIVSTGLLWLHLVLGGDISMQRKRSSYIESNLSSLIAAKSVYERESLEALRKQVGRFRVSLGSRGTWERVVGQFGEAWNAEPGTKYDKNGYSIQFGTFKLQSPAVTDWPKILEAVKGAEAIPGVGIVEFEMKSRGSRENRELDVVRILVAVETAQNGSNSVSIP